MLKLMFSFKKWIFLCVRNLKNIFKCYTLDYSYIHNKSFTNSANILKCIYINNTKFNVKF